MLEADQERSARTDSALIRQIEYEGSYGISRVLECGEMTQQDLAVRVGVTRQTIIALEAGRSAPSLPLAIRIARVFGVGVEDVFHID